jgi:hypothetical protein
MKWGLGQSPKQVDNQSVVMNFETILGEVKVNLGSENSSGCYFFFKLKRNINPNYYFRAGKKLNEY